MSHKKVPKQDWGSMVSPSRPQSRKSMEGHCMPLVGCGGRDVAISPYRQREAVYPSAMSAVSQLMGLRGLRAGVPTG